MRIIEPLLRITRGEVLVNLMSSFISRFIKLEAHREQFENLFGRSDFLSVINEQGQNRPYEDAIVCAYSDELKRRGNFKFASQAYVIDKEMDCKHYHLVYGTNDVRGLEVFRKSERIAMNVMEKARGEVLRRKAGSAGQLELITANEVEGRWPYYEELKARQLDSSKRVIESVLKSRGELSFDELCEHCLQFPLVWSGDIIDWIEGWQDSGQLLLVGLEPRERVPKRKVGHLLRWRGA